MLVFLAFLLALAQCSAHFVDLLPVNDAAEFDAQFEFQEPSWEVFRTASGAVIVELTTTLPSGARFSSPEAHDGPQLAVEDVTDCAVDNVESCVQQFYFISQDVLEGPTADGVMGVQLEIDGGANLTLHFVYNIDIDDLASDATRTLLTVAGRPIVENALAFASTLTEGSQACLVVKHTSPVELYSARACARLADDIDPELGESCDSLIDDIVGANLFSAVDEYSNELWAVQQTVLAPEQLEFCFDPQKLSEYSQLLELQLVESATNRRSMLSLGFGVPQSFTVECEEDLLFDPGTHVCTVTSPHTLSAGWFIAVTVVLVFVCLIAYCSIATVQPQSWHMSPIFTSATKTAAKSSEPKMPALGPIEAENMRISDNDIAYYLPHLVPHKGD